MDQLGEREDIILKAIVEEFVRVVGPVGSRTITKKIPLELSSATIRNVMSDLEDMGYLYQPHTSSGRIPTTTGFRYYVERLMQLMYIEEEEKESISSKVDQIKTDMLEVLKGTSRILSDRIQHACVVLAPGPGHLVLKHIGFVLLSRRRVLVLLVGRSGLVQNRVFDHDEDITQDELDQISNYLNQEIVEDRTIMETRKIIMRELRREKARYNRLVKKALNLGDKALEMSEAKVIVEGQSKILEQPEFADDLDKLKHVIASFEQKATLVKLIDNTMSSEGMQITIGAENPLEEFKDMSVISAGYRRSDSTIGKIGVIGPVRMDYGTIIPFVEFTAHLLSLKFEDN
jgi:heat-inducible transcriptional repressor